MVRVMVTRSIRVPEELWSLVEARAASEDRSAGWVVRKALEQMLGDGAGLRPLGQLGQVTRRVTLRPETKKVEGLAPGEESFAEPHVHKFKPATAGAFIGECACGERGRV